MVGFRFNITISSPNLLRSFGIIVSQSEKTLKSTIIQPKNAECFEITLQLFVPALYLTLPSGHYPLSFYSFFSSCKQSIVYPECTLDIQIVPCSELLYHFTVKGFNLDDLDITSLSDPYFIITSNRAEVYKSEVIMDNLNPEWKPFTVKENLLREYLTFNVWDEDPGSHDFIGVCEVHIEDLKRAPVEIDIHNEKKKGNSKSGRMRITMKKVKNLAEKFFEGISIKSQFVIPCFFEYNHVERVMEVVKSSFLFKESFYFGSGSSESYAWKIGTNIEICDALNDGLLSRKNVGPSIAGPVLNMVLKETDGFSTNLVFVFVIRDFFDPKTVSWIIKKGRSENFFVYFLVKTGNSYPNLESCDGAVLLKYSDYIEEDLLKQYEKIINDLEVYLC